MNKLWKFIIGFISVVSGVLAILKEFFPETYPVMLTWTKGFIASHWLNLIIIALLIVIVTLLHKLLKRNGGSHPQNGQPPQQM